MKKIANIFVFVLFAITIAVGIYFFSQAKATMGLFLTWVYIMFGLTVLLVFTLPLFSTSPKAFKKMAMSVGFLVVVLGIAYFLGTDVPSAGVLSMSKPVSGTTLRLIDVYVIGTYIMLVLAILALVFSSVLNSIRKR